MDDNESDSSDGEVFDYDAFQAQEIDIIAPPCNSQQYA